VVEHRRIATAFIAVIKPVGQGTRGRRFNSLLNSGPFPFSNRKFLLAASAKTFTSPGTWPAVTVTLYVTLRKATTCNRYRWIGW
jgi:hypothetical protein